MKFYCAYDENGERTLKKLRAETLSAAVNEINSAMPDLLFLGAQRITICDESGVILKKI